MSPERTYENHPSLMKPVQLAGYKLEHSTSDKLFKHLRKLGIETTIYQQNLDLVAYLEELALDKPKLRTQAQLQSIAPFLKRLASELIGLHPKLLKSYDLALGAGKTWFGFFERLWLCLPLHDQEALATQTRFYAERERIYTTFPDREPCLHTLVWMDRKRVYVHC